MEQNPNLGRGNIAALSERGEEGRAGETPEHEHARCADQHDEGKIPGAGASKAEECGKREEEEDFSAEHGGGRHGTGEHFAGSRNGGPSEEAEGPEQKIFLATDDFEEERTGGEEAAEEKAGADQTG